MSLQRMPAEQALARMVSGEGFSTIIDARSEGEFALDHLPGAVNWPSLNDEQRIVIGTLFKEKGGFEAQKLGAAWVAVNIARHIERDVLSLPKTWQPLVYCWRGGKRSGALSMVLVMVVGTAMDMTPTILILTPVLMPIVKAAGIDPVYFGVLFIINNAIGLVTPPVGTVLNTVAGVGKMRLDEVTRGVMPFMFAQFAIMFAMVAFPQLVMVPARWFY